MTAITFILPCLNEKETLKGVIDIILSTIFSHFDQEQSEIIVVDNGSTDGSQQVAEKCLATLLHCPIRGYGAALQHGIRAAKNEIVVFADADGSYDFSETPKLVKQLESGFDLVLGSRLKGTILPGAMPPLHRYLGTPVLTALINMMHCTENKISDCNSGFRCFKKQDFLSWEVNSTGMEFASEMLIQAMKAKARISEIPITLHPDQRKHAPHLSTWQDGMRHLLQIMVHSKHFFIRAGICILIPSWIAVFAGLFWGPFPVCYLSLFGLHTMIIALSGTIIGLETWSVGVFLSAREKNSTKDNNWLLSLSETRLLSLLILLFFLSLCAMGMIIWDWSIHDFTFLNMEKETLTLVCIFLNSFLLAMNAFTCHLIKRQD